MGSLIDAAGMLLAAWLRSMATVDMPQAEARQSRRDEIRGRVLAKKAK